MAKQIVNPHPRAWLPPPIALPLGPLLTALHSLPPRPGKRPLPSHRTRAPSRSAQLELLPPPADEEAAEELVAAYRHDLMPFPPPATAGARPAAARAAPRARAEEADFSPEGEATEWDARLPAADPRLPAAARLAVQVRVMRARGLPPKDEGAETRAALRAGRPPPAGPSALASAYCVVTLDDLHRRQRARTRVIPGSCAPCWEEAFTFEGASAEAAIVLDVFDADPFGDDDFLGKATLQLGGLPRDGSAVERTVRLIEGALEVGITIWP